MRIAAVFICDCSAARGGIFVATAESKLVGGELLRLSELSRPLLAATLALACCTQLHAQSPGRDGSGNLSGRGSGPRDGGANLIEQGRPVRDGSGNPVNRGSPPRDGGANLLDRGSSLPPRGR
jgi:hypothetical protein